VTKVETWNAYYILVGKPFGNQGRRREDNIKMDRR
jgi:hypothetical protein